MSEMMKKPSAEVHAMIAQRKCRKISFQAYGAMAF